MAAMLRLKMQGELTVFCQFITIRNLVNYYRALDYETSIAEIVIPKSTKFHHQKTRVQICSGNPLLIRLFFATVSFDEKKVNSSVE